MRHVRRQHHPSPCHLGATPVLITERDGNYLIPEDAGCKSGRRRIVWLQTPTRGTSQTVDVHIGTLSVQYKNITQESEKCYKAQDL